MGLIISDPLRMNQNLLFSYLKVEQLFRNHKKEIKMLLTQALKCQNLLQYEELIVQQWN